MAEAVACSLFNPPIAGLLTVHSNGTFNWSSSTRIDKPLPAGNTRDVASLVDSKVAPGKPIFLKVTLNDGKSHIFSFDSVENRQRARDLLKSSASPDPASSVSPTPSVLSQKRDSPATVESAQRITVPKITIQSGSIPLSSIPRASAITDEDVRARANVLIKDPEVKKLHMDLVGKGLLSEEDFWIGREGRVQEEKVVLRQKQGLSPEALNDPATSIISGPAQEVEMMMTAEMIERVFREHADVLRKYKENVPHMMSEKQFWTAYLHCKYVLGTRRNVERVQAEGQRVASRKRNARTEEEQRKAAELFGDVDEYRLHYRDELESEFQKRLKHIDSSIDLRSTLDDTITISSISGLQQNNVGGYGLAHRSQSDLLVAKSEKELARSLRAKNTPVDKAMAKQIEKAVRDDPVLTKINERAGLAITPTDSSVLTESDRLRRSRLREDHKEELELDNDLSSTPPPPYVELRLAGGVVQSGSGETKIQATPKPVQRPVLNPSDAFPSAQSYYESIEEAEAEARLAKMDPTLRSLPVEIREAYLLAVKALDELCRHFWSTSAESDMKKRSSIIQRMREVQKQIDVDLRQAMRQAVSDALPLLKLPLAQIAKCVEDHDAKTKSSH